MELLLSTGSADVDLAGSPIVEQADVKIKGIEAVRTKRK